MEEPRRRRRFVEGVRERRERHRRRNRIIRITVAAFGFLVVLVGVALIPLPGPGFLVVAIGLAILALEFAWAEHLLERTVDKLEEAENAVRASSPARQALLGVVLVVAAAGAVAVAIAWDLPYLPV
jgi:uncharacterized protein (TIGR02611 family)